MVLSDVRSKDSKCALVLRVGSDQVTLRPQNSAKIVEIGCDIWVP